MDRPHKGEQRHMGGSHIRRAYALGLDRLSGDGSWAPGMDAGSGEPDARRAAAR